MSSISPTPPEQSGEDSQIGNSPGEEAGANDEHLDLGRAPVGDTTEEVTEPNTVERDLKAPAREQVVADVAPQDGSDKPVVWSRKITLKAAAIAGAAVLVIGLAGGAVLGFLVRPEVSTTAEYQSMKHKLSQQLSDTKSELGISQNNLEAANRRVADIKDREAALIAGEAKLKADQAALDQRTQQVQATQFSDGVHLVGTNVTPGIYSISNSANCYYAWMTGTGSDADIIDNNIVSGPTTVTLKPGDVFETNRCGTWTKIG